jgi:hypothetical protein
VVTYAFDRAKIPRTLSFPLKRSALDAALDSAGVTSLAVVYFWMRQRGDVVLRAGYSGEARRAAAAGQSTVTVYAVPVAERRETEAALLREALPRLAAWLRRVESAGNAWRGVEHHLAIHYRAGKLEYTEFD